MHRGVDPNRALPPVTLASVRVCVCACVEVSGSPLAVVYRFVVFGLLNHPLSLCCLQVSRKLDAVLQQQAAEREELQGQVQSCTQQLAEAQDEVALLQQVREMRARSEGSEGRGRYEQEKNVLPTLTNFVRWDDRQQGSRPPLC